MHWPWMTTAHFWKVIDLKKKLFFSNHCKSNCRKSRTICKYNFYNFCYIYCGFHTKLASLLQIVIDLLIRGSRPSIVCLVLYLLSSGAQHDENYWTSRKLDKAACCRGFRIALGGLTHINTNTRNNVTLLVGDRLKTVTISTSPSIIVRSEAQSSPTCARPGYLSLTVQLHYTSFSRLELCKLWLIDIRLLCNVLRGNSELVSCAPTAPKNYNLLRRFEINSIWHHRHVFLRVSYV